MPALTFDIMPNCFKAAFSQVRYAVTRDRCGGFALQSMLAPRVQEPGKGVFRIVQIEGRDLQPLAQCSAGDVSGQRRFAAFGPWSGNGNNPSVARTGRDRTACRAAGIIRQPSEQARLIQREGEDLPFPVSQGDGPCSALVTFG